MNFMSKKMRKIDYLKINQSNALYLFSVNPRFVM